MFWSFSHFVTYSKQLIISIIFQKRFTISHTEAFHQIISLLLQFPQYFSVNTFSSLDTLKFPFLLSAYYIRKMM